MATPALADQSVGAGQTSGPVTLGADENLSNAGAITDNANDAAVRATVNVGTIVNGATGTIRAVGTDSLAIYLGGSASSIVNDGRIVGSNTATDVQTILVFGRVGSLINRGTIEGPSNSTRDLVYLGPVGSIINAAGAVISGHFGLHATGTVDVFSNAGTMTGQGAYAAYFDRRVSAFSNSGLIRTLNTGGTALSFDAGGVGSFDNSGTILGSDREALLFRSLVDNFSNSGTITKASGTNAAVKFDSGALTVVNAKGGTISSPSGRAIEAFGTIMNFTNAGTISGTGDTSIAFGYGVRRFVNAADGVIVNRSGSAANSGVAVFVQTSELVTPADTTFVNQGTISGAPDQLANSGVVVFQNSIGGLGRQISAFTNSGRISGNGIGVYFDSGVASFENSGSIASSGAAAVAIGGALSTVFTNSGTLRGASVAVSFGSGDDRMNLLAGSKVYGSLAFGGGTDTLDFSAFAGNTLLTTSGLETLVPGQRNYVALPGNNQVGIFDISATSNAAIGAGYGNAMLAVNDLVGDALDAGIETPAVEPAAYQEPQLAPAALAATEAAVLTQLDTVEPANGTLWANVIGGASADAASASSVFGGLVAGSHARLDDGLSLGVLAGYVQASSSALGGEATVGSQTGLLGLYGGAKLGIVGIEVSLVGGSSAHTSARKLVAGGRDETATGRFGGTFIAPSIALEIPVYEGDGSEMALTTRVSYVGGRTSAYTETGSSMNLAVGEQTIGLLDLRLGFEGKYRVSGEHKVTLAAKGGVALQSNFGSATVPVTALGQDVMVATPGSSSAALYGGVGVEAAIGNALDLSFHLDGSVRGDGVNTVAARAGLQGRF